MPDTKFSALPVVDPADTIGDDALVSLSDAGVAGRLRYGDLGGIIGRQGGISSPGLVLTEGVDGAPCDATVQGGIARTWAAGWDEEDTIYGGGVGLYGGSTLLTDTPGSSYVYAYGGQVTIVGGHVSVAGTHEAAVLYGDDVHLAGGNALINTPGGPDAYATGGGTARLVGGAASSLDGNTIGGGAQVYATGATDSQGGHVFLVGGNSPAVGGALGGFIDITPGAGAAGFDGHIFLRDFQSRAVIEIGGHPDRLLGFYGETPILRPTATADAASIHAALIALGLIEAP